MGKVESHFTFVTNLTHNVDLDFFLMIYFFHFLVIQRPNTQVVRQCSSTQLYVCVHLQVWKTKTSNNRFAIRDQRSFSTFLIIKSDVYLFSGVTPITNSENRLQIFLEQQQHQHHHISVCVCTSACNCHTSTAAECTS